MPTYEYVCDNCSHEFERQQRITEDAIKECPNCGKEQARRLIVAGNFILKGSGWESDLYSGPSNVKKSGEAKKEAPSTESSTKSETKTEKKSESKPKTESSAPKKKD